MMRKAMAVSGVVIVGLVLAATAFAEGAALLTCLVG